MSVGCGGDAGGGGGDDEAEEGEGGELGDGGAFFGSEQAFDAHGENSSIGSECEDGQVERWFSRRESARA